MYLVGIDKIEFGFLGDVLEDEFAKIEFTVLNPDPIVKDKFIMDLISARKLKNTLEDMFKTIEKKREIRKKLNNTLRKKNE